MKLIVIGLGAVVILIVVVVLAAMHYLKVDDADDFDEVPDEQPRGGTADRDRYAGGRGSAHGTRLPGRPASDGPRRAAAGVGQAAPPAYADQTGGRGPRQRDPRDYAADRDQAADRSGQRTTARYDDGRGAESRSQQRQDSLPAVRPRQARGKRADDAGDWPSTEWDELSDVDYWAEVASDKPLTTTAQPAAPARPARPARPDRDPEIRQPQGRRAAQAPRQDPAPLRNPAPGRESASRPDQASLPDRAPRTDRASRPDQAPRRDRAPGLPVRGRRQPAQAAPSAAGPGFLPAPLAARSQPEAGQWLPSAPPHSQHSEPSLAVLAGLGSRQMPAAPDDDPLTSPSFPRVPASDSRSYHSGRGNTPASGSRVPAPYGAPTEQFAAYAAPSGQLGSYGAAGQQSSPARPRGYGEPGAPAPDRASPQPYRASPPSASPASAGYGGPAGQAAGAGGYPAGQLPGVGTPRPAPAAAPRAAGNPYGSYVSPPSRSGPPASSAGLPGGIPAGYNGYGPGQASGQRQAPYPPPASRADIPAPSAEPGRGWYPETTSGPPPAYPDVSRQPAGPGQEATYLNGSPRAERAGYQAGHELSPGYLPAGYPGPHDGAGYAGPDPYGRDPYGRYPGYGADR